MKEALKLLHSDSVSSRAVTWSPPLGPFRVLGAVEGLADGNCRDGLHSVLLGVGAQNRAALEGVRRLRISAASLLMPERCSWAVPEGAPCVTVTVTL